MGRSRHTDPAQPRHRLETRRVSAADQPEPAAHRFQSHSARRGAQVCRRLNLSIRFDRCVVGQRAVDLLRGNVGGSVALRFVRVSADGVLGVCEAKVFKLIRNGASTVQLP
jgi:hypothetical protein